MPSTSDYNRMYLKVTARLAQVMNEIPVALTAGEFDAADYMQFQVGNLVERQGLLYKQMRDEYAAQSNTR